LRIFGSPAVVKVLDVNRQVWSPKGSSVIFVGYDGSSHNYRFYDPFKHKIIRSHDASFFEDITQHAKVPVLTPATQTAPDRPLPEHNLRDRSKLKQPIRYRNASAHFTTPEPQTYKEAVSSPQSAEWIQAMEEELESHKINGTWELVPRPSDQKIIGNKWVFKQKLNPDGSIARYKARLVAKGYLQQHGIDYNETFSNVCRYESVRILLTMAASLGYHVIQLDVKTAFLYGTLDEVIFMEQPSGFANDKNFVCRLIKSLYGLKQSSMLEHQVQKVS